MNKLLTLALCFTFITSNAQNILPTDQYLEVSLELEESTFRLGEPKYLYFYIQNRSDQTIYVETAGNYRNRLGRYEDYTVKVFDESNQQLNPIDIGFSMGGRVAAIAIDPQSRHRFKLFLPNWVKLEKAGQYRVEVSRAIQTGFEHFYMGKDVKTAMLNKSASTSFEVLEYDEQQMLDLVNQLGKEALDETAENYDNQQQAIFLLSRMEHPKSVAYLSKITRTSLNSGFLQTAIQGLGNHSNNVKAFNALKSILELKPSHFDTREEAKTDPEFTKNVLYSIQLSTVYMIGQHQHRDAAKVLHQYHEHEYSSIRLAIMQQIYQLDKELGKEITAKNLQDEEKIVREEAQRLLAELNKSE
ncbi:MAG: hypothetical protein MK212_02820 [Saprospiraceae bacterium]|nr:hypothetical protein [Saprospiraceae bacterium]